MSYLASRILESALLLVSIVPALLLLAQYEAGGSTLDFSIFQDWYDVAFQVGMLMLGLGSLLLAWMLIRFNLIPAWLAWLGAISYIALLTNSVIVILGYEAQMLAYAPGSVFEIVFPIWLIGKGMNLPKPATA